MQVRQGSKTGPTSQAPLTADPIPRSDSYSPNALEEMDDMCCQEIQTILNMNLTMSKQFTLPESASTMTNTDITATSRDLTGLDLNSDDSLSGLGLSREDLLFDAFSPPARAHNPVVLDTRFRMEVPSRTRGGIGASIFEFSPPLPEDDRFGYLRHRSNSYDDTLYMPRLNLA